MPGPTASPHELNRPGGPEFVGGTAIQNPSRRPVEPGTPPVSGLSATDIRDMIQSRHTNVTFGSPGSNGTPALPPEAQGQPNTRRLDLQA